MTGGGVFAPNSGEESLGQGVVLESGSENDDEQGLFEHFRMSVDPGQAPLRIDKYMSSHMEGTSRHRVQLAIKSGYVQLNGNPAKAKI